MKDEAHQLTETTARDPKGEGDSMKKAIAILAILMFFASGIGLVTAEDFSVPIEILGTEAYCEVTPDLVGPKYTWDITQWGNGGYNDCNVGTDLQLAGTGAWWSQNEDKGMYNSGTYYFCQDGVNLIEHPECAGGGGVVCDLNKYWFGITIDSNLELADIELTAADDKFVNDLKTVYSTFEFSTFGYPTTYPAGQLQAAKNSVLDAEWLGPYKSITDTQFDETGISAMSVPINRYYRFQTGITNAEQNRAGNWSASVPFTVTCYNAP